MAIEIKDLPTSETECREMLTQKLRLAEQVRHEAGPENDFGKILSFGQKSADSNLDAYLQLNAEINALHDQVQKLATIKMSMDMNADRFRDLTTPANAIRQPGRNGELKAGVDRPYTVRDLREVLATSREYKAFREARQPMTVELPFPGLNLKTLVTLSDMSPQNQRDPAVEMALEMRTIADLFVGENTSRPTIEYYEQTTFTNAADFTAEGTTGPEDEVSWTLRTEPVRKVTDFIPMTTESAQDNAELEGAIRNSLSYSIIHKKDRALISGDGIGQNIHGVMGRSGVQTQAKGALTSPEAIFYGLQKVRGLDDDGFAEPTAIIMHPADWTPIRLEKTVTGVYIWGDPSMPGVERMWGIVVRQTTAMTQGTALVGAFRPYATIVAREGLVVVLSTEDGNNFRDGKISVRGEERFALKVTRPAAFAKVTGL